MTLGDHRRDRGAEAAPSFDEAIAAYQTATELHSEPFAATNNLGVCLFKKSQLSSTADRLAVLRDAVAVFEKARDLDPDHVSSHYYLGQSYLRIAQGGNPASGLLGEDVQRALESYQRALELHPRMVVLHNVIGEIRHLQAVHAWEQGEDPEPFFTEARKAYSEGLDAAPKHAFFHQNLAWTAYFQGKVRVRAGGDPGPYLEEALGHARRALELSTRPGAILCIGSAYRLKAEAALRQGGAPSRWLEPAQEALHRVLKVNPHHPEAHRSLGRLYTLEARWRTAMGGDPTAAFDRAGEALDRALELEPAVAYFHLAKARWAQERVRWQPSAEIRSQGLESVEKALELRPGWPEASRLQAILRRADAADSTRLTVRE